MRAGTLVVRGTGILGPIKKLQARLRRKRHIVHGARAPRPSRADLAWEMNFKEGGKSTEWGHRNASTN